MTRPSTQEVLERAHRLMASATGTVSLAATARRARASSLSQCVADLTEATELIRSLLPRSPSAQEDEQ